MNATRASIFALILVLCGAPALPQPESKKKNTDAAPPAAASSAPLRFPLSPRQMPYFGTIDKVDKNGAVQISPPADAARAASGMIYGLTEGYYLGIVGKAAATKLEGARLV